MKNVILISYTLLLILSPNPKGNEYIDKIEEPSPEERGKLIFQKGESYGKIPVTALMSNIEIPATVLPCASCHGMDGKGKPEGGVTPSNITWASLTTNYSGKRSNGRTHPAYTKQTIKRAISMGMDPAGNPLNNTMPKYKMSHQDLNDLLAYLKILGSEKITGITERDIQIGWLPILQKGLPTVDAAQKAAVTAYFNEINTNGGIFNRTLKLTTINPNEESSVAPFAVLGSSVLTHGIGNEMFKLPNIPFIGVVTPMPNTIIYPEQSSFFVYPNLKQQINLFLKNQKATNSLLIIQEEGILREINLTAELTNLNPTIAVLKKSKEQKSFKEIFQQIEKTAPNQVLLVLSRSAEAQFFKELEAIKLPINILLFGSFSKTSIFDLPPFFDNKISLIYPSWVPTKTGKGIQFFQKLQSKYNLSSNFKQSQLAALAAAKLMIEGIQLSGRSITHENFINQLEGLYGYNTDYSPSLSFTKNQHTGSNQLFVIRYLGKSNGLKLDYQIGNK